MLCLFSSKGGVGCSVSAAALALISAETTPTLLVDLRGDLDVILGVAAADQGLSDWLSLDEPSPDVLHRLEVPISAGLSLLPRGACRSPARPDRYRLLARLLGLEDRRVVVDVGTHAVPAVAVVSEATTSVLVTRACYLAVDAARRGPVPDQILLIEEEGRALRPKDVADAIGADVAVCIRWHRDAARAVDAGLLAGRTPGSLKPIERLL